MEQQQQQNEKRRNEWIVSSLFPPGEEEEEESINNNNENDNNTTTAKTTTTTTSETTTGININNTRLIIHFDINETILLGDPAGDDTRDDSLHKMIAKSSFCQIPASSDDEDVGNNKNEDDNTNDKKWKLLLSYDRTSQMEPTHWWDGQEIGNEHCIPKLYTGWEWPKDCIPYYRTKYKSRSKQFCSSQQGDGKIYQPILDECERALQHCNNNVLPAFYKTMEYLIQRGDDQNNGKQKFTVVFRTFGDDIEQISNVITEFAQGKHPDYPNIQYPDLILPSENIYQGRWKKQEEDHHNDDEDDEKGEGNVDTHHHHHYVYQLWDKDETKIIASGDEEILILLENHTCCGIRDDYQFWSSNNCYPTAGKPIWVPSKKNNLLDDANTDDVLYDHHLFFDDNIHNLPNDGIACVRKQLDDDNNKSFITLDGPKMHKESQGIHLIRVPTIEPVLNPNWYIEQIQKAQQRLQLSFVSSK